MGWTDPIQGQADINGDLVDVTFKDKVDAGDVTDTLIARGWVDDIQPGGVDHLHAWNQNSDQPDHHDMRDDEPLFPDTPGLF